MGMHFNAMYELLALLAGENVNYRYTYGTGSARVARLADASLASRIGKVLVTTHEYVKAIEYYSKAVHGDPTKQALRYELAELYLELQKYEQAEKELRALLASSEAAELPLDEGFLHVQALLLLSRVHKEQELLDKARYREV